MPRGKPSRQELFQRLHREVAYMRQEFGGLPSRAQTADVWSDLWHRDAHHSTAIEGNTLALDEVARLLEEGDAVGRRSLNEYIEVKGYADAASWVYARAFESDEQNHDDTLITLWEVRHAHHLTMNPLWTIAPHPHADDTETPGNFRRHQIARFPGGMKPPSWTEVDHLMRDWITATGQLPRQRDGAMIQELADLHHRFEQVHPFLDGNGRTGRLLLNLMLIRLGYPPAIITKNQRERYLRALRSADKGNTGPLAELIARAVLDSLQRFVFPLVASEATLVPLSALVSPQLSENSLRMAARRGRLRAVKDDRGIWHSTPLWRDEYRASRQPRSR